MVQWALLRASIRVKATSERADERLVLGAVLLTLIVPLATLVHELAHALFALRATREPVYVIVGKSPGLVRWRIGRLRVSFHIEPTEGVDWEGLCVWDPARRPSQLMAVFAAGPIASGVYGAVCGFSFAQVGTQHGWALTTALVLGTFVGLTAAYRNGIAAFSASARQRAPTSDGALFARALAMHRELRAHEAKLGRRLTIFELGVLRNTGYLPRSADPNLRASVAPPSVTAQHGSK